MRPESPEYVFSQFPRSRIQLYQICAAISCVRFTSVTEVGENTLTTAPATRRPFPRGWRIAAALILAAAAVLLVGGVFRKSSPPRVARLLPESDGLVYVDAAPIRAALRFDAHPVKHDPDYQAFIDATGIEFERDLSDAAFALHHMANPLGPNGPVAFSSIFVGKFDHQRLSSYLAGKSQTQERYAGHDIYNIAVEGRTDRVVILDSDMVAVSNTPTAEQIHSILDRQRTAFLPFSGSSLLVQHYKEVPLFSLAWGMGKLSAGMDDAFTVFGVKIPLSVNATFIGSLRWTGALRLKIEEIAPNDAAATVSADSIEALLSLAKTAENVLPNSLTNPDTKTLLDSVQIEHHDDRAVLTAVIPIRLLQKLAVAPDDQSTWP
jgi:hypothetical protein